MIARVGLITGKNSCALMMLINEQHKEILQFCINKDPHLSRYYFMQMFELTMTQEYHTNMHFYMEPLINIFDPVKSPLGDGILYPIRADLRISMGRLNGLRAPFRERGFPDFQVIGGASSPATVQVKEAEDKIQKQVVEISFDDAPTKIVEEEDIFS